MPFYSLLPDDPGYPHEGAIDACEDGHPIAGMRLEELLRRIPELLDAVAFLLDPLTTFAAAQRRHRANISRARVRRDRIPTAPTF